MALARGPPYGELTSAAVLLCERPGFYEKPQLSRRLVKRLVRQGDQWSTQDGKGAPVASE
jgi:hypothetical protein